MPTRRKLDVDDCHRMAEVGILDPDERVELIDGELVQMVPIGSEHAATTSRSARVFVRTVGDAALVNTTGPCASIGSTSPGPI